MRPTVLLFDIDGTLITSGTSARRAIERAFEKHTGRRDAFGFPFDGMTDRAIVRIALRNIGMDADEAAIDAFLPLYLEVLEDEMAKAPLFRVHHGMERAVDTARGRDGFAVGLGTGNVKAGAAVKLKRARLHDRFPFGGFGCDHEDRPTLIRIGAERGAAQLGVPLAECRVVIIGDTPKDVHAAQAIGAECIGVGTGHFGPAQLLACGATRAFRHLGEEGALEAVLGH
ncbi:HAD family hydrolase [Vulgatibacter sp.]|uniref:HAD family hydrolase n=1 Tax=Vulgatibacter sp. TaxID=1971226 RepID=UPI00356AA31D